MPRGVIFNPARLDDGEGIYNTLLDHKALYHKSCTQKFKTTMLDRLKVSKKVASYNTLPPKRAKRLKVDSNICVLCGMSIHRSINSHFKYILSILMFNEFLN